MPVILAGDFNQPGIDWKSGSHPSIASDRRSTKEARLLDFTSRFGFSQLVTEPTRQDAILDLVLCNDDSVGEIEVVNSPIPSNHKMVKFRITAQTVPIKDAMGGFDYKRADYENRKLTLCLTDWNLFFDKCQEVDEMYQRFVDLMHMLIESNTPVKRHGNSVIDPLIADRHRRIEREENEKKKQALQKKLVKLCTRKRVIQEHSIVNNSDPNSVHRYVQDRIVVRDSLAAIERPDGSIATEDLEKAEILGDHFDKTYPSPEELRLRRRKRQPQFPEKADLKTVNNTDISPENLAKQLRKMRSKTSDTPDAIPSMVFERLGADVCEPLSLVLRRSLETGIVPRLFRCAIVCPVHRKGKRTDDQYHSPRSHASYSRHPSILDIGECGITEIDSRRPTRLQTTPVFHNAIIGHPIRLDACDE